LLVGLGDDVDVRLALQAPQRLVYAIAGQVLGEFVAQAAQADPLARPGSQLVVGGPDVALDLLDRRRGSAGLGCAFGGVWLPSGGPADGRVSPAGRFGVRCGAQQRGTVVGAFSVDLYLDGAELALAGDGAGLAAAGAFDDADLVAFPQGGVAEVGAYFLAGLALGGGGLGSGLGGGVLGGGGLGCRSGGRRLRGLPG